MENPVTVSSGKTTSNNSLMYFLWSIWLCLSGRGNWLLPWYLVCRFGCQYQMSHGEIYSTISIEGYFSIEDIGIAF